MMSSWKKTKSIKLENGESTIVWNAVGIASTIESRKRLIPHAGGRSGGWYHTTYWVIQPDGTEKEYWRMSEAKEAAEHGTN